MRINTNVSALAAARNLGAVENAVKSSTEKLSSGFRINRAADDAAGLGIANVLRADIRAYTQAQRNAEQANSVYNIAEGAASNIQKMLERMKELATQSASDSVDGTGGTGARGKIDAEFQQLVGEINRTVDTTKFQGATLLKGGFGATADTLSTMLVANTTNGIYSTNITGAGVGAYTLGHIGTAVVMSGVNSIAQTLTLAANAQTALNFTAFGVTINMTGVHANASLQGFNLTVGAAAGTFLVGASGQYTTQDNLTISGAALDLQTSTLFTNALQDVKSLGAAQSALVRLDSAIGLVSTALGSIGAGQSRVESAIENVKTSIQNFAAAESTIRDVDMAEEMVKFSKNQILVQAGTAMLAQANQNSQGVLKLLQ